MPAPCHRIPLCADVPEHSAGAGQGYCTAQVYISVLVVLLHTVAHVLRAVQSLLMNPSYNSVHNTVYPGNWREDESARPGGSTAYAVCVERHLEQRSSRELPAQRQSSRLQTPSSMTLTAISSSPVLATRH
jgi:hypothetical protein